MKKSKRNLKLNINKFSIARLQNLNSILGGDGQENTTTSRECSKIDKENPLCPSNN